MRNCRICLLRVMAFQTDAPEFRVNIRLTRNPQNVKNSLLPLENLSNTSINVVYIDLNHQSMFMPVGLTLLPGL